MSRPGGIDRRRLIGRAAGGAATLMLGGCDRLSSSTWFAQALEQAETITQHMQAAIAPRHALAREYTEADLSPHFKSNGTSDPNDPKYQELARNNFADWRLELGGEVKHPLRLSLDELRGLPSRTQITRHDCVEGWSCIGKWKGVRLSTVLDRAVPRAHAQYVVFYSADALEGSADKYYESIDLTDAYHPQTILAYEMNDEPLPVPYGAPLRLRLERQLGYKMAKYIMRIELVDSFADIGGGRGGYWEDRGYEWYAGI